MSDLDLKPGKWYTLRRNVLTGSLTSSSGLHAGSIIQRTYVGPDGVQWSVTKARSTAKHSNGVEYLIHKNGVTVDYSRKLRGAMQAAEDFANGKRQPTRDA